MIYFIAYLSTALIFLIIDAVWLGVVASSFYKAQLGDLMRPDINFAVAALFYLFYIAGVVFFALKPALESESYIMAGLYGCLFGFFCYATYNFTNIATIQNWPVFMSIVDLSWGTFLTGLSAILGYFVTRYAMGAFS